MFCQWTVREFFSRIGDNNPLIYKLLCELLKFCVGTCELSVLALFGICVEVASAKFLNSIAFSMVFHCKYGQQAYQNPLLSWEFMVLQPKRCSLNWSGVCKMETIIEIRGAMS